MKVIYPFRDLTDNHQYSVGDVFPFDGRKITKKRIDELSGVGNKIGRALIEEAEDDKRAEADSDNGV